MSPGQTYRTLRHDGWSSGRIVYPSSSKANDDPLPALLCDARIARLRVRLPDLLSNLSYLLDLPAFPVLLLPPATALDMSKEPSPG